MRKRNLIFEAKTQVGGQNCRVLCHLTLPLRSNCHTVVGANLKIAIGFWGARSKLPRPYAVKFKFLKISVISRLFSCDFHTIFLSSSTKVHLDADRFVAEYTVCLVQFNLRAISEIL